MAKPRSTKPVKPAPAETGHTQTAFRLPNELIEQIDAFVDEQNKARPWPKMTRSDLVRLALTHVMSERPAWLIGGEAK